MADKMIKIAEGFWNIRGSFKIGGLLDIGTQSSLVRLGSGRFVLLDAYTLTGDVLSHVLELTHGGDDIEAVLHLHPFHTIHVTAVAAQFPKARQYGTERHALKAPDLPWQPERTDSEDLHALYAEDFTFTVPRGVDFIPANENLHFASVLALHEASRTLHVDDTLTYTNLPLVGGVSLHPTLKQVLQKRPSAAAEFRGWCDELVELCGRVDHLCTAHTRPLPPDDTSVQAQVREAVGKVRKTVDAHEEKYG